MQFSIFFFLFLSEYEKMNIKDLNVDGVYEFVEEKFGHHVASNFKGKKLFHGIFKNYLVRVFCFLEH